MSGLDTVSRLRAKGRKDLVVGVTGASFIGLDLIRADSYPVGSIQAMPFCRINANISMWAQIGSSPSLACSHTNFQWLI